MWQYLILVLCGWRKQRIEKVHVSHTNYVGIEECLVYVLSSHLVDLSNLGHLQEYKENKECKCPG